MASNNNFSTPHEREPPTQEYWDKIKSDVFRIYIGDETRNIKPANLEKTMNEIQRLHGLQGCVRTWKDKINEWGFFKNIPTRDKEWIAAKATKRKQEEGKDTVFFHGQVRIAPTRVQDCKRRRTQTVSSPLSVPTPPNFTYNTPSPSCNNTSSEMFEEPTTHPSPLEPVPNASHACRTDSPDSGRKSPAVSTADMQQFPPISMIDVWMAGENQPWSPYALSHQNGKNIKRVLAKNQLLFGQSEDAELAKPENKFGEVQAAGYHSDGQGSPPDIHCIGDQFFPESHSAIDSEQRKEVIEETSLEDVSSLAAKLANSQLEYDEFAPQTLKREFELANALERMSQYEKAEYHCRRILDIHSQIVVEALLGRILAKTHRFEEATFLLFHALAGFIILFFEHTLEENARIFAQIESVMIELLLQTDAGVPSLTDHWSLMKDTLKKPASDGEIYQICPQLFFHGFSFAHECLALGLVNYDQYLLDSAGCLYRDLLKYSSRYLDVAHHAIEKATAHRGYARLLRKEKKWISSAKQWLFACESILDSADPDRDLIKLLERDYHKLLPHLGCEPHKEGSLEQRMQQALARIRDLSPLSMEQIQEPVQGSQVKEYLRSLDSPFHMINLGPSVISDVARFGLSLGIASSAYGDKDRASTTSVTASTSQMSHPWGKTMSAGENRGLGMVF